jgi:hypothetical protein
VSRPNRFLAGAAALAGLGAISVAALAIGGSWQWASYSPYFSAAARALYERAETVPAQSAPGFVTRTYPPRPPRSSTSGAGGGRAAEAARRPANSSRPSVRFGHNYYCV